MGLHPAARQVVLFDHICKLSIEAYYKNYSILQSVQYTSHYFCMLARQPAHNNGCSPLP